MGDQSSVEVNDVVKILKNLRSGETGPPKHAPAENQKNSLIYLEVADSNL